MAQLSGQGRSARLQAGPASPPSPRVQNARAFPGNLPALIEPMLPSAIAEPFDSPNHVFEVAWDGIRALAFIEHGHTRIQDRFGRDVTWRYPELQAVAGQLNGSSLVLDGEIVALEEVDGLPVFERLQRRLAATNPDEISAASAEMPVYFQAFDILCREGRSVMNEPLRTRKRMLKQAVRAQGALGVPDYVERDGVAFFEAAREHGLAGTIAKEVDSRYSPGQTSRAWQVTRVFNRDEFVIAGFTYGGPLRPKQPKIRQPFAALLLGAYDNRRTLRFVGELGGGFDEPTQTEVSSALEGLTTPDCPFDESPPVSRLVFWCEPALVASVAYSGWTPQGRLQFPKFEWLRQDVPPEACRLPEPPR
jgi:bifunctional non-homologous end joining protein LigD